MTDLNSLMIFAKVVEAKSFSEAARRLKMPTSTVSRRMTGIQHAGNPVADDVFDISMRLVNIFPFHMNTTNPGS